MRYLAVDLGDRRTGLAVGDSITGIVTPAGVLDVPRGVRLDAAIDAAIAAHEPDAVVVGLPVNMDGSEGDRAKIARAFGAGIHDRTRQRVEFQDERLTSFAAEQTLARSGRTHKQKKQIRDALAAAEILREYLGAGGTRDRG